jgi:competence protein ComEC
MNRNNWLVICLAYLVGLLSTAIFAFQQESISWYWIALIAVGFCILGSICFFVLPRFYYGIRGTTWLSAGIVAAMAVVYLWLTIPQPQASDISQILTTGKTRLVTVTGKIIESPRLTRNDRVQLWLEVSRVAESPQVIKAVTGRIYVTIPLDRKLELYPNLSLSVKGILYLPTAPKTPHSFNFKYYLRQQHSFAGLRGTEIFLSTDRSPPWWSWWQLRQRIIRSQRHFLGSPQGELLSSMVLGGKVVDLAYELRDQFTGVGLAHIFAASGFQVSLLLGLVLKLSQRYSAKTRFILGLTVLFGYLCLTGVQASIARSTVMGIGALIGLLSDRKVDSLGLLLLAAILLLIISPFWIWDLGFQLSFLATIGLIITVPSLAIRLDWLPPTIADLIAIPIAAFIWTTPLLMYVFQTITLVSIPANVVTAPLVTIVSLIGIVSATCSLILPILGSAIAWVAYYPIELLIRSIELFTQIPLGNLAIGQISLITVFILYGLFILVWLRCSWQKRWLPIFLFSLSLIIIPAIYRHLNLQQLTILAEKQQIAIIIQDRGNTGLITNGDLNMIERQILPFMTSQGINRIDYGVTLTSNSTDQVWAEIKTKISIEQFFSNKKNNDDLTLAKGKVTVKLLQNRPTMLYLQFIDRNYLLIANSTTYLDISNLTLPIDTLLLANAKISLNSIVKTDPKTIIFTNNKISEKIQQIALQQSIKLHSIEIDDPLQWSPQQGWQSISSTNEI